ncbi:uncharacterized protein [Pyxicephalus adspersus]|uniref:uncharacterized protein isoform X2 n=1 Tax=Pyxicephalus adspersus TaxID=30357 RepID=UPI003B5A2C2B
MSPAVALSRLLRHRESFHRLRVNRALALIQHGRRKRARKAAQVCRDRVTSQGCGRRHVLKQAKKMPKTCVVPECRRSEGARESYFKFPLNDKVRLKQWLTNMNVENFFPKKNQYLCSKHFKPTCFQVRWGAHYLRNDAVPTIFSSGRILNRSPVARIRTLSGSNEICAFPISRLDFDEAQPLSKALGFTPDPTSHIDHVSVNETEGLKTDPDPLAIPTTAVGDSNFVPLVHIVESFDGLALDLSQGFTSVALCTEVAEEPHTQEQPLDEPILPEEHIACTTIQQDFYNDHFLQDENEETIYIDVESVDDSVEFQDLSTEQFFEACLPMPEPVTMSSEYVESYLMTMQTTTVGPTLETDPLHPFLSVADTISISTVQAPIASTIPIVSEREEVVSSEEENEREPTQEEPDELTEALATAALVSAVVNIQKTVTALCQRHQNHCSNLEIMVEQYEDEDFIYEEAFHDSSSSTSDDDEEGDTIAIVCEEDSEPLVYTFPHQSDNWTVIQINQ